MVEKAQMGVIPLLEEIRRQVDDQGTTQYTHTALIREHGRDLREINRKLDQIIAMLTPKAEEE